MAAVANDEGAKSREADLKQLAGALAVHSKHHCCVFRTRPDASRSMRRWSAMEAPGRHAHDRKRRHPLPDLSRRVRLGSRGRGIENCCWPRICPPMCAAASPISARAGATCRCRRWRAARAPRSTCTKPTRGSWRWPTKTSPTRICRCIAIGTTLAAGVAERFDAIVCNPPFHALGRGERPDLGYRAFIASRAAAMERRRAVAGREPALALRSRAFADGLRRCASSRSRAASDRARGEVVKLVRRLAQPSATA